LPIRRPLRNDLQSPQALTGLEPRRSTVPLSSLGTRAVVLLSAAGTAYLLHVLYAVVVSRHLFGDASWFLLKMLSENHVAHWYTDYRDFYVGRFGAFAFQEYPTLLFSRLGITSLATLSTIYGVTLFAFKPLSLALCYHFSKDKRAVVFPLLTLFAGSINSEAYIVSETHLFVALFWPALIILLCAESISGATLIVLSVVSAPLILCYESMALYGVVLCAACAYRARTLSRSRGERVAGWILFGWYLLGVVLAVLSFANPRDPANRSGFLRGTFFLLRYGDVAVWASCIVLLLVTIVLLGRIRSPERLRRLVSVCAAVSALVVLQIVLWPGQTNLGFHVMARGINVLVPLLIVPLYLLWHFGRLPIDAAQFRALFISIACLGIAQSAWNILASSEWSNMLTLMRTEIRSASGVIPFERSAMFRRTVGGAPVRSLHGDWPVLPLSIILAETGNVQAMIDPGAGFFRPFNPYAAGSLPALQRYGIRYDRYLAAISTGRKYSIGEPITFDEKGNAASYKTGVWSYPESWGTWSAGMEFGLELETDQPADSDLVFSSLVGAFVNERQRELSAQVLVNDVRIDEWRFAFGRSRTGYETRKAIIPKAVFNKARPCTIVFRLPLMKSPAELGLSGDPRKLGLGFIRAELDRPQDAR
jgi:hypothetical protein